MLLLIIISTFICITLGCIGLYWLLARRGNPVFERLKSTERSKEEATPVSAGAPEENLAERVARPLNRLAPPSVSEAQKLQKQLLMAGYFSRNAPSVYRAIQLASMLGFPGLV